MVCVRLYIDFFQYNENWESTLRNGVVDKGYWKTICYMNFFEVWGEE